MAASIALTASIEIIGVNPYVLVTARQAGELKSGWRKPMPVKLVINNDPKLEWTTNMMPTGTGDFYLYLHGQMRGQSQTKVGDTVTLQVWFDETYHNGPLHDMPDWFEQALHQCQAAQADWNALPPSRQKEVLRYLAGLKSDEAKARNLAQVMFALEGNAAHFMGRDWLAGK